MIAVLQYGAEEFFLLDYSTGDLIGKMGKKQKEDFSIVNLEFNTRIKENMTDINDFQIDLTTNKGYITKSKGSIMVLDFDEGMIEKEIFIPKGEFLFAKSERNNLDTSTSSIMSFGQMGEFFLFDYTNNITFSFENQHYDVLRGVVIVKPIGDSTIGTTQQQRLKDRIYFSYGEDIQLYQWKYDATTNNFKPKLFCSSLVAAY